MNDTKNIAIGQGATLPSGSDRYPATIVEITDDKTVVIQQDSAIRTDANGMSEDQSYDFSPNPNAEKVTFTLRKNGAWIRKGDSLDNGQRLYIGTRRMYRDPSF